MAQLQHKIYSFLSFLIINSLAVNAFAAPKELEKYIYDFVEKLYSDEQYLTEYLSKNTDTLGLEKEPSVLVDVDKNMVEVNDESFTLGRAHLKVFINTPPEHLRSILKNTEDYHLLYNLDKSAVVKAKLKMNESFRAHIFKSLPVVDDQNYVMSYKARESQGRWLQRATLVKDNEELAFREIVQILDPHEGGVIYREIAYIYILRWYLRALGPQVRSITRTEMTNIGRSLKCFAETTYGLEKGSIDKKKKKEVADQCWEKAEAYKEGTKTS